MDLTGNINSLHLYICHHQALHSVRWTLFYILYIHSVYCKLIMNSVKAISDNYELLFYSYKTHFRIRISGLNLHHGLGNLNRCAFSYCFAAVFQMQTIVSSSYTYTLLSWAYPELNRPAVVEVWPEVLSMGFIVQILNRCVWPELFSLSILRISVVIVNEWEEVVSHLCCDTQRRMRLKRRGWTKARLSKRTSG